MTQFGLKEKSFQIKRTLDFCVCVYLRAAINSTMPTPKYTPLTDLTAYFLIKLTSIMRHNTSLQQPEMALMHQARALYANLGTP